VNSSEEWRCCIDPSFLVSEHVYDLVTLTRHVCSRKYCNSSLQLNICKMTSPQGMDGLFWGRDHEDINDWAERLTMAAKVRDLNANKLFKITKLNLRGRAKEWFKRLQPAPADWPELRMLIVQKYGNVDTDDI